MLLKILVTLMVMITQQIWVCEGGRILCFLPYPVMSHHIVAQPLLKALANRGHYVTSVTPFAIEDPPPNYEEIIIPNFQAKPRVQLDVTHKQKFWFWERILVMNELIYWYTANSMYQNQILRDLLSSEREYDAVIDSSTIIQESSAVLQHRFGAVGIELMPHGSSHWTNLLISTPTNPSYMLDFKSPYSEDMDFTQRVENTLIYLRSTLVQWFMYLPAAQKISDRYFRYPGWKERPPLAQLIANKSLVLTNAHFSTNYAVPTSPHVIEISGIHIRPNRPLPKDLKLFMDGAEEGVIYLNFGASLHVSSVLHGNTLRAFVNSLGRLKQRVLWKWEEDEFPGQPGNFMTAKWFPQQDVLAHKNCRLFITHGGYLSLTEAVNFGVPLLGVPLVGDEAKNVMHAVSNGYGLRIDPENITVESLGWALDRLLNDPSYTAAAKARSEIFRDRPMPPLELAVYWIEYVMRHRGAPFLRTALSRLPWYKSMLLDVIGLGLAIVLAAFILFNLLRKALSRIIDSLINRQ